MNLQKLVADIEPEIYQVWKQIHMHPELGLKEFHTSGLIEKELGQKTYVDRMERIGETGWLVEIRGTRPGPCRCIALRGDMDALPVQEDSGFPVRSQVEGVMHACGHDVHTSVLLGAVRVLEHYRDQIAGSVLFFFQPAEEILAGAKLFLESPLIDFGSIDGVAACHVSPEFEAGKIGVRRGPIMASADKANITVLGKAGHCAHPHTTVDPVAIAAQVITALQQIVSREVPPAESAVISVFTIHGGGGRNGCTIIPDRVEMGASIRAVTPQVRAHLLKRIPQVCQGVAGAMGGQAEVELELGPPPFVNDDEWVERVRRCGETLLGKENVVDLAIPSMGAEDFSFVKEKAPGVFVRLGCRTPGGPYGSLHSPTFYTDRKALATGILTLAGIALDFFGVDYNRLS